MSFELIGEEISKVRKEHTCMASEFVGSRMETKKYYNKDGELHRIDGPAIELGNGTKEWYKDGLLHRENGPAV